MVKVKKLSASIFAGAILSTGFAPLGLWFCVPIAYAIYLWALKEEKGTVLNSFIFGFIANLLILSWSKTFVGVTPWILLSILQGIYLLPVGLLARRIKSPVTLLAAVLVMDEAKSYFPFGGFGWTRIAFSQVDSPFLPIVSVTGVVGLSLITLVVTLILIKPKKYPIALLLASLLASPFLITDETSGETLNVRAIQGGVPERGLSFNSRAQAVLDNHINVSLQDYQDSDDVIIWPENAIDVNPLTNSVARLKISELQRKIDKPLIAGAILNGTVLSNAAITFDESATATSIYIKRYLTPFGEYIPLRKFASLVSPHVERVSDFTAGDTFINHQVHGQRVATIICYEILSDSIFRESAINSGVIAVLTNSATFAGSAEGEQQLAITRIRAVENGRNIISVSTTGPSAFINYRGDILEKLSDGEVGSISRELTVQERKTLASKYGGITSVAVLLFALTLIGIGFRRGSST